MPPKAPCPPVLCKCCNTLPPVAFKPWCTSCSLLTPDQHHSLTCKVWAEQQAREALAASPPSFSPMQALSIPLMVLESCSPEAILAGIPPTPHPEPPCPLTPMSTGDNFPLAPADSQANDPSPTPGSPWHPPLYNVKQLFFSILNAFCKWWYLSWDHLLQHIVEAQKAPNGKTFTWVEFTPQFHSYLICSALCLMLEMMLPPGAWPNTGFVWKVKKTIFVFLLEVLSEGPCAGFLNPSDSSFTHAKAAKMRKQHKAWKKTQAAQKEKEKSTGLPVSTSEEPPS
jgi:hypothetical protein